MLGNTVAKQFLECVVRNQAARATTRIGTREIFVATAVGNHDSTGNSTKAKIAVPKNRDDRAYRIASTIYFIDTHKKLMTRTDSQHTDAGFQHLRIPDAIRIPYDDDPAEIVKYFEEQGFMIVSSEEYFSVSRNPSSTS